MSAWLSDDCHVDNHPHCARAGSMYEHVGDCDCICHTPAGEHLRATKRKVRFGDRFRIYSPERENGRQRRWYLEAYTDDPTVTVRLPYAYFRPERTRFGTRLLPVLNVRTYRDRLKFNTWSDAMHALAAIRELIGAHR